MEKHGGWQVLDEPRPPCGGLPHYSRQSPWDTRRRLIHVCLPRRLRHLEDTASIFGEGISVFVGSDPEQRIDAIVCTIDLVKRDSEIKVLIGCTEEEKLAIESLYEAFPPMCGLFLRR